MAKLILLPIGDESGPAPTCSLYDRACGTGNMLTTVGEEPLQTSLSRNSADSNSAALTRDEGIAWNEQ